MIFGDIPAGPEIAFQPTSGTYTPASLEEGTSGNVDTRRSPETAIALTSPDAIREVAEPILPPERLIWSPASAIMAGPAPAKGTFFTFDRSIPATLRNCSIVVSVKLLPPSQPISMDAGSRFPASATSFRL